MGRQPGDTLWTLGLTFLCFTMQFLPSWKCVMHFSISLRWDHLTISVLKICQGQLTPFPDFVRKQAKWWWQLGGVIQSQWKLLFYAITKEIKQGTHLSCRSALVAVCSRSYTPSSAWHRLPSTDLMASPSATTALPLCDSQPMWHRQTPHNRLRSFFWPFSQRFPPLLAMPNCRACSESWSRSRNVTLGHQESAPRQVEQLCSLWSAFHHCLMRTSSASVGGCPGVIREECFIDTLRGAGGGLQQLHPHQCHHQMSGQAQNVSAKPSYCGKAALLSFSTLFPSDLSSF